MDAEPALAMRDERPSPIQAVCRISVRETPFVEVDAEAIKDLSPSEAAYVLLLDRSNDAGIVWSNNFAAPLTDVDCRIVHLDQSSPDLSERSKRRRIDRAGWDPDQQSKPLCRGI